jgi:tetratricopeptide (TPR) repeat protein
MAFRTAAQIAITKTVFDRGVRVVPLLTLRVTKFAILIATLVALAAAVPASAATLDELSLERWAKLREAERFQMNIAEKYYREGNWKVALSEYEKFLSLYEESEGAPYAQLKWSLCQVQLRKPNAAIKDGFQSVIDYWPDSEDAVAASYLIGSAYKTMGEPKLAKKAYANVLTRHPKHLVATLARVDLIDIARVEDDTARRVALWKELTFDTERVGEAANHCATASRELATHSFLTGAFADGVAALATTYAEADVPFQMVEHARTPISNLTAQDDTKPTGQKVADQAIAWLREKLPADTATDENKALARQVSYRIAEIQAAARRADEVPQTYEKIIQQFGADDDTLGRLGYWYRTQAKYDEARATYNRFTNQVAALEQVAQSYREERRYDDGVKVYLQLAGLDPAQAIKWQSMAAYACREAGKCDEAVTIYTGLITADAEHANNWQYQIGETYRAFGRHRDAIAAYQNSDIFPESYQQMGWCYRALGEYKEAISLYQQIIAGHEPTAPWALTQIGYTYEQAGEKENAIKALQRVCRKYFKTPYASEAHAYLNDKFNIRVTLGGGTEGTE